MNNFNSRLGVYVTLKIIRPGGNKNEKISIIYVFDFHISNVLNDNRLIYYY